MAMTDSSSFVNLPTPLPASLSSATTLPLFLLMTSASSTTSPEMSIQSTSSRDLSLDLTNSTSGISPFDLSSGADQLSPSGSELTDSSVDSPLDSSEGSNMRFPFYLRFSATAICLLLLIIGCPGNLLVPYVVMKTKELRNSTNIFLMNLSVSDLMILLISSPTILIELHSQPETWFLGLFMCKAVSFIEICVAHVSILTILAISFERYYAICRPLVAGYKCTKRRALLIIVIIWLIAITSTLPMLNITQLLDATYLDDTIVPSCQNSLTASWHPYYFFGTFILFFAIPFVILLMLYCFISKKLTSDSKSISASSNLQRRTQVRRQVVMMLASVCVTFFICLLPFRLLTLWIVVTAHEDIMKIGVDFYYILLFTCRLLLYVNSSINPILYNVISSKFRCAFCKILNIGYWSPRRLRRRRTSKYYTSNTYTYNNNNNYNYNQPSHSVTLMNPLAKESTYLSERVSDKTVVNPLENSPFGGGSKTVSPPPLDEPIQSSSPSLSPSPSPSPPPHLLHPHHTPTNHPHPHPHHHQQHLTVSKIPSTTGATVTKTTTTTTIVITTKPNCPMAHGPNSTHKANNLPVAVHIKYHSMINGKVNPNNNHSTSDFVINSGANVNNNPSEITSGVSRQKSFMM